jgi:hypothetical protein
MESLVLNLSTPHIRAGSTSPSLFISIGLLIIPEFTRPSQDEAFEPKVAGTIENYACFLGLLKKTTSGVLVIFPCSRTKRTLRAQNKGGPLWDTLNHAWPCWTDSFEPAQSLW